VKYRLYLFLGAALLLLLSFPKKQMEQVRTVFISSLIPSWQGISWVQGGLGSILFGHAEVSAKESAGVREQLLTLQLQRMKSWLFNEKQLSDQCTVYSLLSQKSDDPFFERRRDYLAKIIEKGLVAVPAKVIFREPTTWSSSIWLNVGEKDNKELKQKIIAVNSPVVLGKNVVGVVEEVGKSRCRVRLLTDPSLTPSVRVVRGSEQNRVLLKALDTLEEIIEGREDLGGLEELKTALKEVSLQLPQEARTLYLAKGEIHGCRGSLGRMRGAVLKGEGFNYDFADEEGPARDLRTGKSMDSSMDEPLIKVGDLLVTTGMDGVFPPDLNVGIVSKIFSLHEGGCSYSLEAHPTISDFNQLTEVFILPPQ